MKRLAASIAVIAVCVVAAADEGTTFPADKLIPFGQRLRGAEWGQVLNSHIFHRLPG